METEAPSIVVRRPRGSKAGCSDAKAEKELRGVQRGEGPLLCSDICHIDSASVEEEMGAVQVDEEEEAPERAVASSADSVS